MGPGSSGSARPASFFSSLTDGLTFHPHSRPNSVLSLSLVPNLRTFELAAIILETFSHPPPPPVSHKAPPQSSHAGRVSLSTHHCICYCYLCL